MTRIALCRRKKETQERKYTIIRKIVLRKMTLTTSIMLVAWESISNPRFSRSLCFSLGATIFAISVTTDYRCDGSYLMVTINARSGV